MAIEHLIAIGHREIALLGVLSQHSTAAERERGYREALRQADLPLRTELIIAAIFARPAATRGSRRCWASVSTQPSSWQTT